MQVTGLPPAGSYRKAFLFLEPDSRASRGLPGEDVRSHPIPCSARPIRTKTPAVWSQPVGVQMLRAPSFGARHVL